LHRWALVAFSVDPPEGPAARLARHQGSIVEHLKSGIIELLQQQQQQQQQQQKQDSRCVALIAQ
jgi:hypothetical protein